MRRAGCIKSIAIRIGAGRQPVAKHMRRQWEPAECKAGNRRIAPVTMKNRAYGSEYAREMCERMPPRAKIGREALPKNREALPKNREALPENREALPENREALPESREVLQESREALPESREALQESREVLPESREALQESREVLPIRRRTASGSAGQRLFELSKNCR